MQGSWSSEAWDNGVDAVVESLRCDGAVLTVRFRNASNSGSYGVSTSPHTTTFKWDVELAPAGGEDVKSQVVTLRPGDSDTTALYFPPACLGHFFVFRHVTSVTHS
jgi:hypothetical protein